MSDSVGVDFGPTGIDTVADGMGTTGDPVVDEAKKRFQRCSEWESSARERYIEDLKFSYGDSDNGYQWPNAIRRSRDVESRPCLTMNILRQHNLQIINEGKRNKASVKVIPVGNGATAEAAKMWRGIFDHIEYQSNAQTAYSVAREFQVFAGLGYWRLVTDWVPGTWEQEIYIRSVPDPLTVYLDPDIRERDGSDAAFAFVFDTVPREDFREAYPDFVELAGVQPFGIGAADDDWVTKDHIRICEYFRKVPKKDKVLHFVDPQTGERRTAKASGLHRKMVKAILDDPQTRSRDEMGEVVEWKLIAGDRVIDETEWPGKYIPLIRCLGEETVIEGILDRKGHTRAMKDAQRMYNYNASGQVEFVALQSKTPWRGAAAAIEEYETYWNTANTANHSFLPFNHLDDNGNPIPPEALPQRQDPPAASPAFEMGMQTAFNQLMMASGQWQNQMGMQGNERTGEAIKRRQDQGDTATYHFQDNFDLALAFTGKQLIDLVPRIYDTKRVLQIQAEDGTDLEIEIDPGARAAYLQQIGHNGEVAKRIFNPSVGRFDVRAAPGNAKNSGREATVEALTLILTQNPGLTGIVGDLLLSAMDFDKAQEAAQRLKRMVPPQALGTGPSQQEQQLMLQLRQTQAALGEALGKLGKEQQKLVGKDQMRDIDAYKAETDRMKALGDSMGQLDPEGTRSAIEDLVREAAHTHLTPILRANAADMDDQAEGARADAEAEATANAPEGSKPKKGPAYAGMSTANAEAMAPFPGSRQASDGEWYTTDPTRKGKYMRIAPLVQEHRPRGIVANA